MIKEKKGAIELSFSTIVVLVLAMTMLILGLVLIRSIFIGAQENVQSLNDKVKGEINKLFEEQEDRAIIIYLSDNKADIKRGESFGVAFGIRNSEGGAAASQFSYEVEVDTDEEDLEQKCGISDNQALSYLIEGKSGTLTIQPNKIEYGLIRVMPPRDGPVCLFRYRIEVKKANALYTSGFFDVNLK